MNAEGLLSPYAPVCCYDRASIGPLKLAGARAGF